MTRTVRRSSEERAGVRICTKGQESPLRRGTEGSSGWAEESEAAGTEAREEIINGAPPPFFFFFCDSHFCTNEGKAREGEKVWSEREPPKCPSMDGWINRM